MYTHLAYFFNLSLFIIHLFIALSVFFLDSLLPVPVRLLFSSHTLQVSNDSVVESEADGGAASGGEAAVGGEQKEPSGATSSSRLPPPPPTRAFTSTFSCLLPPEKPPLSHFFTFSNRIIFLLHCPAYPSIFTLPTLPTYLPSHHHILIPGCFSPPPLSFPTKYFILISFFAFIHRSPSPSHLFFPPT